MYMVEAVLVIGASGRVGSQTAIDLAAHDIHVYAASRNIKNIPERDKITPVTLDITTASVEEMVDLMGNVDAVVFTAGSRGENLLQVDAFGAVKAMQAAEVANIEHFVLLSAMYALEPEYWEMEPLKSLTDFNIAKFFADRYLIDNTTLDFTILQPGALIEAEYTGKITTDITNETKKENGIADVAAALTEIILNPQTKNRVIKMSAGQTPIKEALVK